MESSSPESHDLARQLLAYEMQGPFLEEQAGPVATEAGVRICQKLYEQMAQLIGPAGFDALATRALHLAQVEFPFLDGVAIETEEEGCLKGLNESVMGQPTTAVTLSIEAIFANFIYLLITLIGMDLALRQLRNIWPEVSPGGTGGAKEGMK